jgi:hypothetical protein
MNLPGISRFIPICLIGYGIIAAILTIVFFASSGSILIGYDDANRSTNGRCAALALLAQHMIIASGLYWTGVAIAFRQHSKWGRLTFIAGGIGLIALSYFSFIIACFCSG